MLARWKCRAFTRHRSIILLLACMFEFCLAVLPVAADEQITPFAYNTGTNSDLTSGDWNFNGTVTYTLEVNQGTGGRTYTFGGNSATVILRKESGYIDALIKYDLSLVIYTLATGEPSHSGLTLRPGR